MARNTILISAVIVLATVGVVALVQGWVPTASDEPAQAPEMRAASFTLTDLETGDEITLDSYAGEPLVIHVFASWCALCTGTARSIASYEADFNVLLISADTRESDAQLLEFKERFGTESWRVARLTPEVERSYAVRSLDTKFVIDAEGMISHTDTRSWRASDAERYIGDVV